MNETPDPCEPAGIHLQVDALAPTGQQAPVANDSGHIVRSYNHGRKSKPAGRSATKIDEEPSSSERLGHELPLIGAFGMGISAVASNVYVWAAHPNRKRIAMIAGFASFVGCVAVLAFWYLRLIQ